MSPKTLRAIHDDSILIAKNTPPVIVQKGKLYRWKGNVTSFLKGELEFRCFPYFSIVYRDSTATIPCILVNPFKNSLKLIFLCNNTVLLNEPEIVVEVFVINSQEFSLVQILLDAEKLKIIERNLKFITPRLELLKDLNPANKNLSKPECCEKIIPLKISSAILSPESDIVCLVLVVLRNYPNQKYLWLVLRNKEVIWKDLLIPNKLFNIRFPADVPVNYLRQPSTIYNYFDSRWDISFQQLLHHKELMKTHAYAFLPPNSKILSSSEEVELDEYSEKWIDFTDNSLKSLTFASVYGVIKDIRYINAWKSFNCSWCTRYDNVFEQSMQDDQHKQENEIEVTTDLLQNSWSSPTTAFKNPLDEVEFPDVELKKPQGEKISGFGIRGGKLTVQIILQKKYSDMVSYVFLKRWIATQYPAGLIPGVTVCFTNVNVKKSKKNFCYFISTPITRILHLETNYIENFTIPQHWGPFGFPFFRNFSQKFWGVLDLDLLSKVSINAKCKACSEPFIQYRCSNTLCVNSGFQLNAEYEVVALARVFIRTPSGDPCNLFLKNENVRRYLQIPERIWQKLCSLSALTELLYLYQGNFVESENMDFPNIFFRRYCQFFRPKVRYHVCCKLFKDSGDRFFCIELSEMNNSRVSATENAIKTKMSSKNSSE